MRKTLVIINLLLIFTLLQGAKINTGLEKIKTLKIQVIEERKVVENKKEILTSKYDLIMVLPDKLKKIQTYPEINKGEVYIYTKGKKTVYLPFFDQVTEESIKDEKTILDYFKEIVKLSQEDEEFAKGIKLGKSSFYSGKDIRVDLKGIYKSEGIYLPTRMEIFEKNDSVAKLIFNNIVINSDVKASEFQFKK